MHIGGYADDHQANDVRKDNGPIPVQLKMASAFLQARGSKLRGVHRCTMQKITCTAALFAAGASFCQASSVMVAFFRCTRYDSSICTVL